VVTGSGSPTNELMRHMLFVLLLTQIFDVDPRLYLVLIFILHATTMIVPFKLTVLIRGLAKTATTIIFKHSVGGGMAHTSRYTSYSTILHRHLLVFIYRWRAALAKRTGIKIIIIKL